MISQEGSFGASIAAKKAGIQIRNYHMMGFRYQGFTGTICITADIPGPSEIIDNIGGYKCRVKDAHDLRDKTRIVVRNRQKHIPADIANRAVLFYNADTLNKEILKRKQKLLGL